MRFWASASWRRGGGLEGAAGPGGSSGQGCRHAQRGSKGDVGPQASISRFHTEQQRKASEGQDHRHVYVWAERTRMARIRAVSPCSATVLQGRVCVIGQARKTASLYTNKASCITRLLQVCKGIVEGHSELWAICGKCEMCEASRQTRQAPPYKPTWVQTGACRGPPNSCPWLT